MKKLGWSQTRCASWRGRRCAETSLSLDALRCHLGTVMSVRSFAPLLGAAALACGSPQPVARQSPAAPAAPAPVAPASPAPLASATASAPPAAEPVATPNAADRILWRRACAAFECLEFAHEKDAFAYVVRERPRVVGVGETHVQRGGPAVHSATRRFGETLLPVLQGTATDLVIELLTPDPKCKKEQTDAVAERTKPITESQASTNQNEFVTLGFAAKRLGIAPRALAPTCDEYQSVLDAGQSDVLRFLSLIADVTVRDVSELLAKRPSTATIVAYGGALHNDATPRAGRESMSYAPRLRERTGGSYVEVDLIVPEFVRDEEPWRSLPWYAAFDRTLARRETSLIVLSPTAYVLVFPHSLPPPEKAP